MIVNKSNTNPNLSRLDNYDNSKMWGNIHSVYLTTLDFVFNNETDFDTESVWKNAIGNDYIVPIHNVKESENISEEAVYNLNIHDIEVKTRDGKVRLAIRLNCPIEYHNELLNYDKKEYNVMFAIENRTVLARLNGTQITGLETDQISVERIQLGNMPAWTLIKIELNNIAEIYDKQMSFIPYHTKNVDVVVNSVTHTGTNDISFHVEDRVCGIDIEGLETASISLIDLVNGSVSNNTFTDNGDGNYTITTTEDLYEGTINIFSEDYNGTGVYEFAEYVLPEFNPSEFNNAEFNVG